MSHAEHDEPRAGWIACLVFAVGFAALAVWNLRTGTPWVGAGFALTALAWLAVAIWRRRWVNAHSRR
ncbi:hypothetical protein [Microbacterium rhizomatis]|uniref:Uncharacterized protein n=1 Tax=Microbacterium rhizomatis TaxID=1631477 RepID=A0A5J5J2B6_9MICO|nr:hypothetical protein [Microbacterium rhizomatis]KAA9108174.1 hypothetical protein F6B43_12285 [Microbacterium rhizomatis]